MSTTKRSEAAAEVLATESLQAAASAPLAVPSLASVDEGSRILAVIQHSLERGLSVEAMSGMLDLYERVHRRTAEHEFAGAFARFQSRCPSVQKVRTAKVAMKSGGSYSFTYADYEAIADEVGPHLSAEGFSYTFDTEATAAMLKVTCTLRHVAGHSVSASFACPTENASGATPQQKFGGARTYAKRMTLIDVLGLTLTDPESPEEAAASQPLSEEQTASLNALLSEVCAAEADRVRFFKFMNVTTVADITAGRYGEAVRALEKKRGGK